VICLRLARQAKVMQLYVVTAVVSSKVTVDRQQVLLKAFVAECGTKVKPKQNNFQRWSPDGHKD